MAILAFFNGIFLKAMGFLLTTILIWTVPPSTKTTIVPVDEANLKLQFSVISDVHMETNEYDRLRGFAQALTDIANSKQRQDALVLLGDNTMNGQTTEYIMFYSLLSRYNNARNTFVAIGNHDLNQSTYEVGEATRRHNLFLQSYTGISTNGKPYYARKVDGYTFVIMGDEGPLWDARATISQAQLDWLDQTLAEAARDGKPIFVFNHQPLNHTFPNYDWGGVGSQSEKIRLILKKYNSIFFFSGHLHTKATKLKLQKKDGVTYVDLPTLLSKEPTGVGYQVEVYAGQVRLRARNYITGEWVARNDYTIDLV